ncbi:hypothetical protein [Aeoliella mucimassa]|nr:hypothetical protein [Aeoliella mucimassa]
MNTLSTLPATTASSSAKLLADEQVHWDNTASFSPKYVDHSTRTTKP